MEFETQQRDLRHHHSHNQMNSQSSHSNSNIGKVHASPPPSPKRERLRRNHSNSEDSVSYFPEDTANRGREQEIERERERERERIRPRNFSREPLEGMGPLFPRLPSRRMFFMLGLTAITMLFVAVNLASSASACPQMYRDLDVVKKMGMLDFAEVAASSRDRAQRRSLLAQRSIHSSNVDKNDDDGIPYDDDSPQTAKLNAKSEGMVSTTSANQKRPAPLNFLTDPDRVVEVFQDCASDPNCHFTYHHVSKTGGTTIEEAFFPHFGQETVSTCCHGRILAKFHTDPEHYCQEKFTSWQVSFRKFYEVVDKCRELDPDRRTVVWTTFREPVATFVSLVHQMCNKNIDKRDEAQRLACETCAYTNETASVWREYAQSVEWQIKGAYRTSRQYLNTPNVTSIVMEPNDLNQFWESFSGRTLVARNAEKQSACSFKPTSELLKSMGMAQEVYRRMVASGQVTEDILEENGVFPGRYSDPHPRSDRKKANLKEAEKEALREAVARKTLAKS